MAGVIRRGKALRADLALWDGRNTTASRIDATGGTITGVPIGDRVDVLHVFGNATDRTHTSLSAALNHISSNKACLTLAPGTWTVGASLTIPANVSLYVPAGCTISVNTGVTLTINGLTISDAPSFTSGAGTVSFIGGVQGPYITSVETSAAVTPTDYSVPPHEKSGVVYAARYGFRTSASAATNLAALQAALAVKAALGGGVIMLPSGTFALTAEFTINSDDTVIVGQGSLSTIISFNPSSTAVCFNFDGGGSSLERVGVIGVGFTSSNSNNKTAIRFEDGRDFKVSDIVITNGGWAGSGSIGIHTLGRDTLKAKKLHILCARPIVIDGNTNHATLDCDHFHFRDMEIGSTETSGKCIEITNGTHFTNLTIDGYQAWLLGAHGIYWSDSSTTIDSYNVKIAGVRSEQATDATGYSVYLESSAQDLKAISIENCNFDSARNGVYLRKPECISIRDCFFTGSTGRTNLDITFQSRTLLEIENSEISASSTVTLTNAVQVWGTALNSSVESIPKTVTYRFDEGALVSRRVRLADGVRHFSYKGTIGDDVTINLPITAVNGADVAHLRIALGSATGPVLEGGNLLWRPGTVSTAGVTSNVVTTNTDAKLCVLDSSNALIVLNRLGGTMDIVLDAVIGD